MNGPRAILAVAALAAASCGGEPTAPDGGNPFSSLIDHLKHELESLAKSEVDAIKSAGSAAVSQVQSTAKTAEGEIQSAAGKAEADIKSAGGKAEADIKSAGGKVATTIEQGAEGAVTEVLRVFEREAAGEVKAAIGRLAKVQALDDSDVQLQIGPVVMQWQDFGQRAHGIELALEDAISADALAETVKSLEPTTVGVLLEASIAVGVETEDLGISVQVDVPPDAVEQAIHAIFQH